MVRIGLISPGTLAAAVWAYVTRTLTNPPTASDLANMLVGISPTATGRAARLDYLDHSVLDVHDDLAARETFETVIPVTPVSGSYGEKVAQEIIRSEVILGAGGEITISAGGVGGVSITPGAGEIWELFYGGLLHGRAANSYILFQVYDPVAATGRNLLWVQIAGTYGLAMPTGFVKAVADDTS